MIAVFESFSMRELLNQVMSLCRQAGGRITDIYQATERAPVDVMIKSDHSPLTQADLEANVILVEGLSRLLPGVPILSEEGDIPPVAERELWPEFWLVDPLDGTKEFIHRTGDFTVNVALIRDSKPVLGVVYAPMPGTLYGAINTQSDDAGAFKYQQQTVKRLRIAEALTNQHPLRIVNSRRHGVEALASLLEYLNARVDIAEQVAVGSSLKHCLVAEGRADFYPRFGLTSQWDTAAAQAIVEAAGGFVVDRQWQPLSYRQHESLLNPEFYVLGDTINAWRDLLADFTISP